MIDELDFSSLLRDSDILDQLDDSVKKPASKVQPTPKNISYSNTTNLDS